MPINNLFNNTTLETSYQVSPFQIIASNDHNSLLTENRNKFLFTQSNADTQIGGIGIETRYIANSAITSSKINLQAGTLFPSSGNYQSPGVIGRNQTWTSPAFGNFSIVWEKPFMYAELDFEVMWSIWFAVSSNPDIYWFTGSIELYAVESGANVLIGTYPSNLGYLGNEKFLSGAALNSVFFSFAETYTDMMSRNVKLFYYNTTGQASTSFFFKGIITNKTQQTSGGYSTPNPGNISVNRIHYKTYNQIHS